MEKAIEDVLKKKKELEDLVATKPEYKDEAKLLDKVKLSIESAKKLSLSCKNTGYNVHNVMKLPSSLFNSPHPIPGRSETFV